MNARIHGMTVKELIEALQDYPADKQVLFASDFGDHSHTMQVHGIGNTEEVQVRESAYSDSRYALDSERYPTENPEDLSDETFVVIKSC